MNEEVWNDIWTYMDAAVKKIDPKVTKFGYTCFKHVRQDNESLWGVRFVLPTPGQKYHEESGILFMKRVIISHKTATKNILFVSVLATSNDNIKEIRPHDMHAKTSLNTSVFSCP